jgi:4-diphosphocytidyl-2-C-methyl-D-erythritol kinase
LKKNLYLLLINPEIELSTKKVFEIFDSSKDCNKQISNKSYHDINEILDQNKNDLEPISCKLVPEIKEIIDFLKLQNNSRFTRMSGSGATVFTIFDNKQDLESAFDNSIKKFNGYYIKKSQIV